MASRWEGVRLPRASGKPPDFPGSSPNFPGSFSATSPEVLSLWYFTAIQRFPGNFPDFPGSSPDLPGLPRKFPALPRRSALSLGSLTPSPDSQKLPLRSHCLVNFAASSVFSCFCQRLPCKSTSERCVRTLEKGPTYTTNPYPRATSRTPYLFEVSCPSRAINKEHPPSSENSRKQGGARMPLS